MRVCDGICKDCDCGAIKALSQKPARTKEEQHLHDMERAYVVLKNIAEGGGTHPRIYAQNTIDAIKGGY